MRQTPVTIALLVVLPLSLGGCMMAMHGGGHAATRPEAQHPGTLATGQTGNTTIDVTVREVGTQGEAIVTASVTDTASREPVENARVSVRVRPVASAQDGTHHGAVPDIDFVELTALAAPDRPGVYEARHQFPSDGPHEIQVALRALEQDGADRLVLTATYHVQATEHRSRRVTPLAIVGGIVMAAAMAVRILVF